MIGRLEALSLLRREGLDTVIPLPALGRYALTKETGSSPSDAERANPAGEPSLFADLF